MIIAAGVGSYLLAFGGIFIVVALNAWAWRRADLVPIPKESVDAAKKVTWLLAGLYVLIALFNCAYPHADPLHLLVPPHLPGRRPDRRRVLRLLHLRDECLGRLPWAQGVAAMQRINVVVLNPAFLGVFMGTALLGLLCIGAAVLIRRLGPCKVCAARGRGAELRARLLLRHHGLQRAAQRRCVRPRPWPSRLALCA
ncbi:MAG TPA: hypothetical protein VLJ19_18770 [Variovorax sp.]|nr:hypothetical protein [Variovorax sp.]